MKGIIILLNGDRKQAFLSSSTSGGQICKNLCNLLLIVLLEELQRSCLHSKHICMPSG
jgi:hypothetical protein